MLPLQPLFCCSERELNIFLILKMELSTRLTLRTNIYLALYYLLCLIVPTLAVTTTAGVITIEITPGYLSQRECVQSALWSGRNVAGESNLITWLGCTNHLDSCLCRDDLASSASSLLTSGINSWCSSDAADVSGGISAYNSYCSRTGTMTINSVAATTTADSVQVTVTTTATVTSSTASGIGLSSTREFILILASGVVLWLLPILG